MLISSSIKKGFVIVFGFFIILTTTPAVSDDSEYLYDGQLDQEQLISDDVEYIFNNAIIAQSFKPVRGNLTHIKLLLSKRGTVAFNLSVGIRSNIVGADLVSTIVSNSTVTDEEKWVQINFSNALLQPEETYYIVCTAYDGNINNSYCWYASGNDTYNRGLKYFSHNNGLNWFQDDEKDLCFQTFSKRLDNPLGFKIHYIDGERSQISYGIKNIGESNISDINVFLKINGGIMLTGRQYNMEITSTLEPGETADRFVFPVIGFGLSTTITVSAWIGNSAQVNRTVESVFLGSFIYIRPD